MAGTAGERTPASEDVIERLVTRLDRALEAVKEAKTFAKSTYQTDIFQIAETLMASHEGLRALYSRAHRFDECGVFEGGAWADPSKLLPPLVAGSLKATGVYPVVETLSELRMLAIAKDRVAQPLVTAKEAADFLEETMALNLEFLFPSDTEQERIEGGIHRDSNIRLFGLLAEELSLSSLLDDVLAEIEQICAQRPIMTEGVRRMIDMARRIPSESSEPERDAKLSRYQLAVSGPSTESRGHPKLSDYRKALRTLDDSALQTEAESFAESMAETGLVSQHHAVLLRFLGAHKPEYVATALALNDAGAAELESHLDFSRRLIKVAILPSTAQSIYGLRGVLRRGLLSRQEVTAGLSRIVEIDLQTDVRRRLLGRRTRRDGVTANSILLAGTLSVLGQPLGVGQGLNPTCQAARGISLWAQHAPGMLLELVISAARDGLVQMSFDGVQLDSSKLFGGLARNLDPELDPVSLVLVPHLDRLYDELMKRVALRPEDGHKWVNPALYGRWVPNGFASVFLDVAQTTVADYEDFVRRFFATHHPAYNDGHPLMYPNPVGICVTNGHGDYLGPHAVSLQRITEDPQGTLRAYFFNPNNEGRQDWGHGIRPSIRGHGEEEGESSLPFHEFVARLYAFHYNPFEEGDAYAVPDEEVQEIESMARRTWGRAFIWADQ